MMYLGNQAVGLATSLPVFSNLVKVEAGSYTPETDIDTSFDIAHSLGQIPDFLIIIPEEQISLSSEKQYLVMYEFCNVQAIDRDDIYYIARGVIMNNDVGYYRGYTYGSALLTSTSFKIYLSNAILKANVKYNYIVGKFKEVTSNAS